MKTGASISSFTSERARSAFLADYEATLDDLWPQRRTEDVSTTFGTTRVFRDGRADAGAPFVLLPGAGGNSLMWHRYVGPLALARQVIAVDPVGDPGGSTQTRPFTDGEELAAWLDEVLAALGVDSAHVVGVSYGGWVALQHAVHRPGRATTVTLMEPGGFGRITVRVMSWIILGGLAGLAPRPVRHRAARWLRNATLLDDDLIGLMRHAMSFRRRMPLPRPVTDEELAAVSAPTQLLLGGHSALHDSRAVADRANRLMRDVRVEIVPDASHDLPMHSVEHLTKRIIDFAQRADAEA
jgi:pimeloyl-ACP methyl ester carboxylesterase